MRRLGERGSMSSNHAPVLVSYQLGIACLSLVGIWTSGSAAGLRAQEAPVALAAERDENAAANSAEGKRLRNVHRFEKAFLVRACQLTDAQKDEVEKLDESWKEALRQQDKAPRAEVARVFFQGLIAANERNAPETPDHKFRTSLRAKFAELLTDEQRKTYQEELAARDEFRQRADAECLVEFLDKALGLTPEQREPLARRLAKWPGKDDLYIQYFFNANGMLPSIPDNLLSPHLSPKQMAIYRNARKVDIRLSQLQSEPEDAFGE